MSPRRRSDARVRLVPPVPAVRLNCKDCPPGTKRPAPHPGPRCATHNRERRRATRKAAHGRRLELTYHITLDVFDALLFVQGGACAICQRARGVSRNLSVDHDHAQAVLDGHDPEKGCPACVRGLLCGTCNKMLGHLRDSPETFERAAEYLRSWPSKLAPVRAALERAATTTRKTPTTPSAPGAGE